jgi:hypothetical protein
LQSLGFQHLVKPAFGLCVVFVDESKYLGATLGLNTLVGNDESDSNRGLGKPAYLKTIRYLMVLC